MRRLDAWLTAALASAGIALLCIAILDVAGFLPFVFTFGKRLSRTPATAR